MTIVIRSGKRMTDVVGVTKSWVDDKITDVEIRIDGYELFRCDRSVGIKGGVLLYIRSTLSASSIELIADYPEQFWCKLKYNGNKELLVGVCYRTPSESVYGNSAHCKVREILHEVSKKEFLLMGDFNYKGIDWRQNCWDSNATVESTLFLECVNKCLLRQHVDFLTTDKSILDLVISRDLDIVSNVQDLGSFDSSDHRLLGFNLSIVRNHEEVSNVRYDYRRMDIKGAVEVMKTVNWEDVLKGTVNEDWENLKATLFRIQEKYVPVLKARNKFKQPWLSYRALRCVRNKHRVFKRYKDSRHLACKRATSRASREVLEAKHNFERSWRRMSRKTRSPFLRTLFSAGTGSHAEDTTHN